MHFITIILIFSFGIQKVDAFTSTWNIKFSNDQEKTLQTSAITEDGYQLSVVLDGRSRKMVLPHANIKSAQPLYSLSVEVRLDSIRSNSAFLLGIKDSTVFLAGQTPHHQWRTLSLKASQLQSVQYADSVIDLSFDWDPSQGDDPSQLKYLVPPPSGPSSRGSTPQITPPQDDLLALNNSLYIDSESEDAFVYINDLPTIVSSPYRFVNLSPGLYNFELRWEVNKNLWSAHGEKQLTRNARQNIYLTSQRNRPEMTIQTIPSNATIKFDNSHEADFERHWVSPLQIKDLKPGIRKVTLLKPGYKDTTIFINVMASQPALLVVELETDLTVDNSLFHRKLQRKRWGATLLWSSIPLAALGVVYHALAETQLQVAWESKDKLRQFGLHTDRSERYIATKKKNRQAVEEASSHYDSSHILFGFATILSLSGIVLYF